MNTWIQLHYWFWMSALDCAPKSLFLVKQLDGTTQPQWRSLPWMRENQHCRASWRHVKNVQRARAGCLFSCACEQHASNKDFCRTYVHFCVHGWSIIWPYDGRIVVLWSIMSASSKFDSFARKKLHEFLLGFEWEEDDDERIRITNNNALIYAAIAAATTRRDDTAHGAGKRVRRIGNPGKTIVNCAIRKFAMLVTDKNTHSDTPNAEADVEHTRSQTGIARPISTRIIRNYKDGLFYQGGLWALRWYVCGAEIQEFSCAFFGGGAEHLSTPDAMRLSADPTTRLGQLFHKR